MQFNIRKTLKMSLSEILADYKTGKGVSGPRE
jgi:hypothetical protein